MNLKEIYERVALEEGIDKKDIEKIYRNYWKFVRKFLASIVLKDTDYSEEEYNKLRTSINIPSIGKFYCTYKRYLSVKRKFNHK